MKNNTKIEELKTKLDPASSVLIMLPIQVNVDKLAAALALYLSLQQVGKQVAIVSESDLKVAQAGLFGIGEIKTGLPESNTGNFIIKLDGVVQDNKVPALEKLDWFPTGNDLNLVFHVVAGQKFEPINISHHYDTTTFQLIFFIGGASFADFGQVYNANADKFNEVIKVNIDNTGDNNLFGQINIIDANNSAISEIMSQIIQTLGLPQDSDIATNLVTGIYNATQNLTVNVSGETFIAIGQEMQLGAKVPFLSVPLGVGLDVSQYTKQSSDRITSLIETPTEGVVSEKVEESTLKTQPTEQARSPFETPIGEQAVSTGPENMNPAPDWLTPKVFGGKSLG